MDVEQLDVEEKVISVTFLVTPTMDKEVKKLMTKKRWKRSAFIRVAIQKELNRLAEESK